MNCPKCKKGEIQIEVNLIGIIFNRRKIYTYFCPLCDYKNKKEFKINEAEYQVELEKKG